MKLMRLAACAVAFAVVGGMAVAEDMDIKALQAKLAAQEARLNDLQAKMGSGSSATPANITSMKKNAKVTIGGAVDTRYYARFGEVDTADDVAGAAAAAAAGTGKRDISGASLEIATATLGVQVDVNENMDAYLEMDLHDAVSRDGVSGVAAKYYVRWKNICNSGWGILVGRDSLKFGMGNPIGARAPFSKDQDPESSFVSAPVGAGDSEGMFMDGTYIPTHVGYGQGRTTQINPYWENACQTLKAEFSIFQSLESKDGRVANLYRDSEGFTHRRTINYGLGSGALRLTWTPSDDWTFVAGAINMHTNGGDWAAYRNRGNNNANTPNIVATGVGSIATEAAGGTKNGVANGAIDSDLLNKNNYAYHLGVTYTPAAFCDRLTLWANFQQEFNAGWIDDQDNIIITGGAMYALTDKLTGFVEGDYMYTKNGNGLNWYKANGWRGVIGAKYNLGGGASFETGYMYSTFDYENRAGVEHTTVDANTIYANLGFSF